MAEELVVGVDLGTTFSTIAYVDVKVDGRPHAIPNAAGDVMTPSVVWIDGNRRVVGKEALNRWFIDDAHVVRWIKLAMGRPEYLFQGLTPAAISAEILRVLKDDAQTFLGREARRAVITCPAYFTSLEIENTKLAGELAGFEVREIVKEPTAAAVFYGIDNMQDGEKILVCDLGGGTFDATVLHLLKGVFTPLASCGDQELGGHQWTEDLRDMVADMFQARYGMDPRNDVVAAQYLYEACERAKRDFSQVESAVIPCQCGDRLEQIQVSRTDFENRTEGRIQRMVARSESALAKISLPWSGLDRILLVGGSSRLRRMALAIEKRSGKAATRAAQPDLMVALGAAILAQGKVVRRPKTSLMDVSRTNLMEDIAYDRTTARNLGIRVVVFDADKPRIANSLLIPHGVKAPVSRTREDFEVAADGQEFFDVPVVQFEDDDTFVVHANHRFKCLPNAKRGDRIRVSFEYDISEIMTVKAADCKTGRQLSGDRLPYEEPTLPPVRSKPRWVVFAVDTSYSMDGDKIEDARQAVLENSRLLLALGGERSKVGIVRFDSNARAVLNPTSDMNAVERAVQDLIPTGTTAMDAGIREALRMVLQAPDGTDRDVVMVTDGMPDSSCRSGTLTAAGECGDRKVTLSSVGIGKRDVDEGFLKQLSPIFFVVDSAKDLGDTITNLLVQSAQARAGRLTDN